MKFARHRYNERLTDAAEEFLINQFDAPTQFTEAGHLPDLIEAAMHIVTGAAWVQPEQYRERPRDVYMDEIGGDEGEDEDEDEE